MEKSRAEKILELVKRNYQAIASDFDATRKKEIWPEIRGVAAGIKDGAKIIDVGCGNGRLLEALKGKKIEYLGVDNSSELIKRARYNYSANKFLAGDILDLEKIAGKYDHVFCLAVLQHLPGEELRLKALRELKNKLAGGGQMVISVWNLWEARPGRKNYRSLLFKNWFLKIIGRNDLDIGDLIFPWKDSRGEAVSDRYYHAFRGNELKRLTASAGLNIKEFKKDRFNYWLILSNK